MLLTGDKNLAPTLDRLGFSSFPGQGLCTVSACLLKKRCVQKAPGLHFVTQNCFNIKQEWCDEFEEVWKRRESHLKEMPGRGRCCTGSNSTKLHALRLSHAGFIRFAMLRGDETGEYISSTTWASRADFERWTQSDQARGSRATPSLLGSTH